MKLQPYTQFRRNGEVRNDVFELDLGLFNLKLTQINSEMNCIADYVQMVRAKWITSTKSKFSVRMDGGHEWRSDESV